MTDSERVLKAFLDPPDVFDSPLEVLADEELTKGQKIEILRRWVYDASEISVAEGEGMSIGNGDLLRQIMLALKELDVEIDPTRRPPTRQGGYDRESLRQRKSET
ncbi:MAG: hypothetical protein ACQEVT_17420 [Pseudomonadota bacterium]|uniref:hypothetical protein n=1 Tax=Roseovarius sp. TaxID=1486281 RepID=UPI0035662E05